MREIIEARLAASPPPPLENTRSFLRAYFGDALSIEEVRESLVRLVAINSRSVLEDLAGIEALLASSSNEPGVLADLVAWDANWVLDDPSDEGAKRFLSEVAEMIREVSRQSVTASGRGKTLSGT